jgi:hypothetical protein
MAKALALANKTAIMASRFTGSKMRSADGEGEEGGDAGDFEPGRKLTFTQVKVNEAFAQEISKHPGVFQFLFNYGPNNKPKEPASDRIGPIRIVEKFKGCSVTIEFGLSKRVDVANARVSSIRLEAVGAECHMRCDIQGLFPMSLETLELEAKSGEQVRIWVKFGAVEEQDESSTGKQQDFVESQNDEQGSEQPATNGLPAKGGAVPGVTH